MNPVPPSWVDDKALEIARKYTALPKKRAALQVEIVAVMMSLIEQRDHFKAAYARKLEDEARALTLASELTEHISTNCETTRNTEMLVALRELVRCVKGGDALAGFSMDDALEDAEKALEGGWRFFRCESSGSVGANDPQQCQWPDCECKKIDASFRAGLVKTTEKPKCADKLCLGDCGLGEVESISERKRNCGVNAREAIHEITAR